jgi:hypothetical protein
MSKLRRERLTALVSSSLIMMALAGCGGGGGGGSSNTASGPTLSGTAVADLVNNGQVAAYEIGANGSTSAAPLGAAVTQADGTFSIHLNHAPVGGVKIVLTGGSYTSEADTTKTVTGTSLSVIVPAVSNSGASGLAVTPLTSMAAAYTQAQLQSGAQSQIADALKAADTKVENTFGLQTAPETLVPQFNATKGDAATAALINGALEQLALNYQVTPQNLYAALAADFADGVLDGKAGNTTVNLSTGVPLPSSAGNADLISALNAYTGKTTGTKLNQLGLNVASLTPAVSNLKQNLVNASSSPDLKVGSSGAMASLFYTPSGTTTQKQLVLVAARTNGLVSIDVTDPNKPQVDTLSTLNQNIFSQIGSSVDGVIAIPGAVTPQVLVYSYGSVNVALVDLQNTTVTGLTLSINNQTTHSGQDGYITGGLPDIKNNGVWLTTGDGYQFIDTSDPTALKAWQPISFASGSGAPENVGGDTASGMLLSPSYDEYGMTPPALQWVDLNKGKSYALANYTTYMGGTYSMPDSAFVDSIYHVGVVLQEHGSSAMAIDMHDPASFKFDDTAQSFIPANASQFKNIVLDSNVGVSGGAVDSTNHLALMMAGNRQGLAVVQIADPTVTAASWTGLTDWRTYVASLSEMTSAGDPHAVAVVHSAKDGKSYGFVLDSSLQKVIKVDLAGFLQMQAQSGTHTVAVSPFSGPTPFAVPITWQ